MMRFTIVALFVSTFVHALLTQSGTQAPPPCRVKELLNRKGWDIPGLSKATVKTHARYVSEGIPKEVFIDIMESQAPEAFLTYVGLESCEN